jgi:hypothetical protein
LARQSRNRIVLVVVLVVVLDFASFFEDLPSLGFGKAGEDEDEDEKPSQRASKLDHCNARSSLARRRCGGSRPCWVAHLVSIAPLPNQAGPAFPAGAKIRR